MSDIVWTRDSEWRSAQHAEKAIIGEYELVVFDLAADEHHQAEIGWEIFAGPGRTDQLAGIARAAAPSTDTTQLIHVRDGPPCCFGRPLRLFKRRAVASGTRKLSDRQQLALDAVETVKRLEGMSGPIAAHTTTRARAKARGVRMGRPPKLTRHQQKEAIAHLAAGETLRDIARTFGVSHSTISRLRSALPVSQP